MSFSLSKPTVQMLGRWQPWHDGHTELFKRAIKETGQVAIMVRNILDKDNPFEFHQISSDIQWALKQIGYEHHIDYIIMQVPNIVDISYGRGVGYTFTEHDLGKEIHNISATNIRKEMREKGEL
jgi:FAD synthase|tara:strand:- start:363 stop:734 length:372 start_codon:yes stop_codon:yes gene_type:complete